MPRQYRSQVDFKKYSRGSTTQKTGLFSFFKKRKKQKELITNNQSFERPLSNPWRQQPKKNWRNIIAFSFSLLFIFFWIGLMLYLPYFQINKVSIEGQKITDIQEIEHFVREEYLNKHKILKGSNYFILRKSKIEQGMIERFGLQNATIEKSFPHGIKIIIQEKICSVIYFDGYKYFLLDKDGKEVTQILNDIKPLEVVYVQNEVPEEMNTSTTSTSTSFTAPEINYTIKPDIGLIRKNEFDQPIVVIKNNDNESTETLLTALVVQKIIEWKTTFGITNTEEIKYFEIEKGVSGVKVFIDKNWYIMFDPKLDITIQLNSLRSILSEVKPSEYIDLRFGDKIYWK